MYLKHFTLSADSLESVINLVARIPATQPLVSNPSLYLKESELLGKDSFQGFDKNKI